MTTCLSSMARVIRLGAALSLLTTPNLTAANADTNSTATPNTSAISAKLGKVGKRSGAVIEVNTTNATIKIRARVVRMGSSRPDESSIPTYTVSYDQATKFVHPKNGETTVADVEVGSKVFLSYYETNGIKMAINVVCGFPDPETLPLRQSSPSTNELKAADNGTGILGKP
jgi:hypothetical protein